ncbi:MAG: chemotaxis protein CheW, partial [Oceanisphaera sp.]
FQVLFFEVAGMTFAVPLTHLGGIYQMSKLTSLFGKPDWFAGMLTERDRQLYVVDTARWAMPSHQSAEEYEYLVTLGDSNWGLSCHQLKGTALLTREQVKWRVTPGARPWLAGMVKEKMCALLHVDALISLLEQGKNIDGQQV